MKNRHSIDEIQDTRDTQVRVATFPFSICTNSNGSQTACSRAPLPSALVGCTRRRCPARRSMCSSSESPNCGMLRLKSCHRHSIAMSSPTAGLLLLHNNAPTRQDSLPRQKKAMSSQQRRSAFEFIRRQVQASMTRLVSTYFVLAGSTMALLLADTDSISIL